MREGHDVVIVDLQPGKLRAAEDDLDVQTITGNACDPALLKSIGIEETDLLLAVTERDEVNLIAAFTGKSLGAARVVARVRSRFFYEQQHMDYRSPLGIDLLVSPEVLTAHELARFVAVPSALAMATLARGRAQLLTLKLKEDSPYANKPLMELRLPKGALIVGYRHENEVEVAHGDSVLKPDDRVTLIGLPEVLDKLQPDFTEMHEDDLKGKATVAIAGAGETGLYLAELLERRGHRVIVLEKDRERSEYAAEKLRRSKVFHGDATEVNILREERIGNLDYYIAATGDDENNVMSSLLAKELGVKRTACIIDRPDYARIIEKIGIDVAISPRFIVANRVLAMVKRGRLRSLTILEEGELEVTEFQALSKSEIVGQMLKDVKIPRGSLIGAVGNGDNIEIPRGDYVIRPGAIVIGIAKTSVADKLDDLFAAEVTGK